MVCHCFCWGYAFVKTGVKKEKVRSLNANYEPLVISVHAMKGIEVACHIPPAGCWQSKLRGRNEWLRWGMLMFRKMH